jgi:hypothetical protein
MRTRGNYILDNNHKPVPVAEIREWARWYETADRHVGRTQIDEMIVSTVFLGIDHSWDGAKPLLFETMVFEPNHNDPDLGLDFVQSDDFAPSGLPWRYSTWDEAEAGHAQMCELVRAAIQERGELGALLKDVDGL